VRARRWCRARARSSRAAACTAPAASGRERTDRARRAPASSALQRETRRGRSAFDGTGIEGAADWHGGGALGLTAAAASLCDCAPPGVPGVASTATAAYAPALTSRRSP
jgi:hypothetical protein